MTYEEAVHHMEEALDHRAKLSPNSDKDLVYLVEAQVKQYAALVSAFKKHPDK
jgi:hypothetical protein